MLTQQRIQELIALPKIIVRRLPSHGYREENGNRRCDLELRSDGQDDGTFAVFIRQNLQFVENFPIGLRYRADLPLGAITLMRYNGPHGESSRAPDGHYAQPHIHRITEQELASGEHTTTGTRSHDHSPVHNAGPGALGFLRRRKRVEL